MTTHQNDHTFAFDPNNSLTNRIIQRTEFQNTIIKLQEQCKNWKGSLWGLSSKRAVGNTRQPCQRTQPGRHGKPERMW